jgi:hypothetical protein
MAKGTKRIVISKACGILGGVMAFGGLILFGISPDLLMATTLIELAAILLLLFFFVHHFEVFKAFSVRRSTRLGANSLLMIFLFLTLLTLLNFIFTQHSHRFDLSETGKFSLAPQTIKVLENLNREVKVTDFFRMEAVPGRNLRISLKATDITRKSSTTNSLIPIGVPPLPNSMALRHTTQLCWRAESRRLG